MTIQELSKTQEGAGQEAIGSIPSEDLNITAPGKLRVIKRNGKVVPFEEDKIKVAVTKAFLANESGNAIFEPSDTDMSKVSCSLPASNSSALIVLVISFTATFIFRPPAWMLY